MSKAKSKESNITSFDASQKSNQISLGFAIHLILVKSERSKMSIALTQPLMRVRDVQTPQLCLLYGFV